MAQTIRSNARTILAGRMAVQPEAFHAEPGMSCMASTLITGPEGSSLLPASMPAPRPASRHGIRRKSLGQGMTEYIVIVALVGVAAIGVYSFLGQTVRGATSGIALELAGEDSKKGIDEAKKAADKAVDASKKKATLKNYGEGNH